MEEIKKSYYATIPATVRYDNRITANAKLLYGEITALCNEKGYCWANNSYFAELYSVSKITVSTWIKSLVDAGYIETEIIYREGTKEILNRYIKISEYPIKKILNTPIKENLKENNTNNNITLNKEKSIKKESKFMPPTLEEINEYIKEKKLAVDGKKFFDYFNEGGWIDSKGNKVRNWKQKLLTWNGYGSVISKEKIESEHDIDFIEDFINKGINYTGGK